ncbi:MAG: MarR family transcriptional regulator [Chloroflexota bacterium]
MRQAAQVHRVEEDGSHILAGESFDNSGLPHDLRWTPRYVTALIDALESEGWVQRASHPTDRRATLVSLSDRGTTAAERMLAERGKAAGQLFGHPRRSR